MRRNRRAYQSALAEVEEGQTVCATLSPDGEPKYFIMPVDASDDEVRAQAFRERNGRFMSRVEKNLLELAEREPDAGR